MQINIHEPEANLSQLIERVIAGEEIILDKEGVPIAKLIPYQESQTDSSVAQEGKTLADLLSDYIGAVDSREHVSGGAQMSKETGKKFAEGMVKKREEGRL